LALGISAVFLVGFMSGIYIIVLMAGLFVTPAILSFIGYGGNSFFLEPYLQMLSNTTPKEYEKEIEKDFQNIFVSVVTAARSRLQGKPPFSERLPIDDPFVTKVAVAWRNHRGLFLERESAARNRGAQHFARFLIARMQMAKKIWSCLSLLEMSRLEWSSARDIVEDLTRMASGENIFRS